jgi:hypothetical protein
MAHPSLAHFDSRTASCDVNDSHSTAELIDGAYLTAKASRLFDGPVGMQGQPSGARVSRAAFCWLRYYARRRSLSQ